jgi:hypothetical protein
MADDNLCLDRTGLQNGDLLKVRASETFAPYKGLLDVSPDCACFHVGVTLTSFASQVEECDIAAPGQIWKWEHYRAAA